jgi:hypothetical protein
MAPAIILPPETLQKLYEIQTSSGLSPNDFGRAYFRDPKFFQRRRRGRPIFTANQRRIEDVLARATEGTLSTVPRRAMSTDVYPFVMEAVEVSRLTETKFAARHIGYAQAISHMRRKPRLLTPKITARIAAACTAILGRPIDFSQSPRSGEQPAATAANLKEGI